MNRSLIGMLVTGLLVVGTAGAAQGALVSHYDFEEGSGSTTLDVVNSNPGTLVNATWTTGRHGGALNFNGSSAYVGCDFRPDYLATTGTIMAWVKFNHGGVTGFPVSLPYATSGWSPPYTSLSLSYGTAANILGNVNGGYAACTLNGQPPHNVWTHVAGTFDGSIWKLYINGGLRGTRYASGSIQYSGSPQLAIGVRSVGSLAEWFNGAIDEVKLYNTALTASEIVAAMDLEEPQLVAHYDFEEGSGSTTYDTVNANAGTFVGDTAWSANGVDGKCIFVDGSGDHVDCAFRSDYLVTNGTIMAWIKPVNLAGAGYPASIPYDDVAAWDAPYLSLALMVHGADTISHGNSAGVYKSVGAGTAVPVGVWTHLAGTYDGTYWRVYVNGELLAQSAATSGNIQYSGSPHLCIGERSVDILGEPFYGHIDEVKLYNGALSADQIREAIRVPKRLVAYWDFDEGSGVTTYDSVDSNAGTINGATWTSAGKIGNALSFDGNDYVDCAYRGDYLVTTGTIMAWVKPTSSSSGAIAGLPYSAASGWPDPYIGLALLHTTDRVKVYGNAGGTGNHVDMPLLTPLDLNVWTHVAGTYDGKSWKLYINGVLRKVFPTAGNIAYTGYVHLPIGVRSVTAPGDYFVGVIDEVKLYNYALNGAEISEAAEMGGVPGCVALYQFNEGSGTETYDEINGNTGTINGATWTTGRSHTTALSFDGNDYVSCAFRPDYLLPEGSIEAWVRSTMAAGNGFVVSLPYTPSWSAPSAAMSLNSGGNATVIGNNLGVYIGLAGNSGPLPQNTWTHIAGTFDGFTWKYYVNGVLKDSKLAIGDIFYSGSPHLSIGVRSVHSLSEYYQGVVDDVALFTHALSADDVEAHYLYGVNPPIPGTMIIIR